MLKIKSLCIEKSKISHFLGVLTEHEQSQTVNSKIRWFCFAALSSHDDELGIHFNILFANSIVYKRNLKFRDWCSFIVQSVLLLF